MSAPTVNSWAAVCDRCSILYLIGTFPHACLCPSCYLGAMEPAERGRLLGHVAKTGQRIDWRTS